MLTAYGAGLVRASREGRSARAPEGPSEVQCDEETDDECSRAVKRTGVCGAAGIPHRPGQSSYRHKYTLIYITRKKKKKQYLFYLVYVRWCFSSLFL